MNMQATYNYIKRVFSEFAFFLLLFPLFFIYSGYNELFGFLTFKYVFGNFLIILSIAACIFVLFFFIFRNIKKAAVYCFLIELVLLIFGFIHDSLKTFGITAFLTKYTILIPVIIVIFIILFFLVRRSKRNFSDLFTFLNLLFLILLLSEIPNSIKRYQLDKSVHNLIDFRFTAFHNYAPQNKQADTSKPDIYLLVFDALGSTTSIKTHLDFDNSNLDSFLKKNGFFVLKNAKANYNWTIYSMSTMFNLEYLPHWIVPVMNEPKVHFWGTEALKNNSLFQILKSENYKIYNYQPLSFDNNDWPGPPYFGFFKTQHFYFKTLPGRLQRDIFWNFMTTDISFIKNKQLIAIEERNKQQKELLDTTIALVKKTCSLGPIPKFVYGHFMTTHDPYIFDSTGKVLGGEQALAKNKKNEAKDYINQVKVADSIINELVQHIKQTNKQNTIIIVTGDHGFPTEIINRSGYSFDMFSAFYFPDQQYATLYDSIQPINYFRIILNKFFKTNYPLLKDSSVVVTTETELIKKGTSIK